MIDVGVRCSGGSLKYSFIYIRRQKVLFFWAINITDVISHITRSYIEVYTMLSLNRSRNWKRARCWFGGAIGHPDNATVCKLKLMLMWQLCVWAVKIKSSSSAQLGNSEFTALQIHTLACIHEFHVYAWCRTSYAPRDTPDKHPIDSGCYISDAELSDRQTAFFWPTDNEKVWMKISAVYGAIVKTT